MANCWKRSLILFPAIFGFGVTASLARTERPATPVKALILAQQLVEDAQAQHPEVTEAGIVMRSAHRCSTVASTDAGDIGETCEAEDEAPMRTGKPHAAKEKDGFDVSVPLRDSAGHVVGALGLEFKPAPGQTREEVTQRAQKIAAEMASQIPSRDALLVLSR